ncbi:MAG: serine hydrolase domain-containing protein [Actinomycetota bacterium]
MTTLDTPSDLSTIDPAEVGLDADRLARIDRHFTRFVDDGRLPGWQIAVVRHDQLAHHSVYGRRDLAEDAVDGGRWTPDTIVRMYSMTKPITSVAAMMLAEEGAFELKTPVAEFLPEFATTPVYRGGSSQKPMTVPQTEPIRMWHLLTHTSGLTYGFHHSHVTDALYRQAGFEFGVPRDMTLSDCCAAWSQLPLAFQPGTEWLYGVSTDVLGRVVEVVSEMPLDEFFRQRVLWPLGMVDTDFHVPDERRDRVAGLFVPHAETGLAHPMRTPVPSSPPTMLGGGGGLWGTMSDYVRFCRFLLRRGELDGVRLLSPRTVEWMTSNHLPGGADLEHFGRPLFAETTYDGVGFGLGFSVTVDPVANKVPSSVGEFGWGGAASTAFWCDPVEDLAVVFLTQLLPSDTHPIRSGLKQLVSQALVD